MSNLHHFTDMAWSVLQAWDLDIRTVELVKYRENAVFRVATEAGDYALRLHRPGYHSIDELQSEADWLAVLQREGIAVPALVPTCQGEWLASVADKDGVVWFCDLLKWVSGEALGTVEKGLEGDAALQQQRFRRLGRECARLHQVCERSFAGQALPRHAWDAEGLVGNEPFWGPFWELAALSADQKQRLTEIRQCLQKELADYPVQADFGLIHADLVPENVLCDGDDICLIDFDDAGYGWYLFELVTALYFLTDDQGYDAIRKALLDGYQTVRPLPARLEQDWDLFMMLRGLTYLGWLHTRQDTATTQEMSGPLIERCMRMVDIWMQARS
jgi:Ser/Thr protein kinase RdoA (MazF antagonist)